MNASMQGFPLPAQSSLTIAELTLSDWTRVLVYDGAAGTRVCDPAGRVRGAGAGHRRRWIRCCRGGNRYVASGGGGGGLVLAAVQVRPGQSISHTVGAGGAAVYLGALANGNAGGTSSFGSAVSALGGAGGVWSSGGVAAAGASGGSVSIGYALRVWAANAGGGSGSATSSVTLNAAASGGGSAACVWSAGQASGAALASSGSTGAASGGASVSLRLQGNEQCERWVWDPGEHWNSRWRATVSVRRCR